tara:strand:- start:8505 stop:10073 length:1569 start_codon:yes stop_codon:yes gene_type:complete
MKKVLVIGLDGVSPELLFDSWIKDLPNLKKIYDNGAISNLKSAFPPVTAPAWVSFATGKNPGKHGIFDFIYLGKSMDDIKTVSSSDIKVKTYYEILNENGRKNIIINMPLSHPPKTDDIIMTNFLAKSNKNVFPESLINEIPELKEYRPLHNLDLGIKNFDEFIADISDVEEKRFICAKKLFYRPWDTFFVLFESTDFLHHHKYRDMLKRKDNSILNFYKKIDSYIGWFMENMDKNTTLIIMSDHGFKTIEGVILVNNILRKKGFIKLSEDKKHNYYTNPFTESYGELKKNLPKFYIDSFYDKLTKVPVLFKIAKNIARSFNNLLFRLELKNKVNRAESIAFLPAFSGYIYLNKRERFNDGKVSLNEYEDVLNNIKSYLESLKDDKQRPLFKKIYKKNEMYKGPMVKYAPDLLFISDDYHFDTFPHGALNVKKVQGSTHADTGIFMAYGNDIANKKNIKCISIMDIAPTILFIMNCPIPDDVDGRILKEIFKSESTLYKAKIRYTKDSEQEMIKKTVASIKI